MREKFQNKYLIKSARLPSWNYSWPNGHYVTICTQDMKIHFGEIINGEMKLNEIGLIVRNELLKTPMIRNNAKPSSYNFYN